LKSPVYDPTEYNLFEQIQKKLKQIETK